MASNNDSDNDKKTTEKVHLDETEAKYAQIGRLLAARGNGHVNPGVNHALLEENVEGVHYLVGYEGSGRGSTRVLLWKGPLKELLTGLLKGVGFTIKGTLGDVREL